MKESIPSFLSVSHRNLIFVSGKGGVGKTIVSQAIARALSRQGKRTLWVTFEDPTQPKGDTRSIAPNLWYLNCDATKAFEEYAAMKIGSSKLTHLFVHNRLMQYLAEAAPGFHELVLLGKVWHERLKYDHVVVDMPSTGYGLAMFQSAGNFSEVFRGGPLHRDASEMLATVGSHEACGHLIVALPEEMPLQESIELDGFLQKLFPDNRAAFLINRRFPDLAGALNRHESNPEESNPGWSTPLATSIEDYSVRRSTLENYNLRLWRDQGIPFEEIPFLPPPVERMHEGLVELVSENLTTRGLV